MTAFSLLADLHDALVLARNHASDMDVLQFVSGSDEFRRASEFLHNAAQGMEAQRATTSSGVVHDSPVREANAPNPPPIALPSEQPNDR